MSAKNAKSAASTLKEQMEAAPKHYFGQICWSSRTFNYIKLFSCATYEQDKSEATHLSLVGGKGGAYNLHGNPNDPTESYEANERTLWRHMAEDRASASDYRPSYIVERRGPVFPHLYDFDLHAIEDTPFDQFVPLVRCVQRLMNLVYNKTSVFQRRAIVCTAPLTEKMRDVTRDKQNERMKLIKRGFHLIYPDLLTNQQDALFLRCAVVKALQKEFGNEFISFVDPKDGERVFCDTYNDLVDPTVITDNGLRMIGAHKADFCPNGCKKKNIMDKDNACVLCGNWGRFDAGRPYEVIATIDGNGKVYKIDEPLNEDEPISVELHRMKNDFIEALRLCSIRRPADAKKTEPDWVTAGTDCAFTDADRELVARQEGIKSKARKVRNERYLEIPGTYTLGRKNYTTYYPSNKCFKEIEALMKRCYDTTPWRLLRDNNNTGQPLWQECGGAISTMGVEWPPNKRPSIRAYPVNNFCPNVGREHTSNRTYFDIFWSPQKQHYFIQPGCYSNHVIRDMEPCNKAKKFFTLYKTEISNDVERLITSMTGRDKDKAGVGGVELIAPQPYMCPDPDAIVKNVNQKVHEWCYGCKKYMEPSDSHLTECKCEKPDFAPPNFRCAACNKMHTRKGKKRKLLAFMPTVVMHEECACDLPTAPEKYRDTMSSDEIKNSTL